MHHVIFLLKYNYNCIVKWQYTWNVSRSIHFWRAKCLDLWPKAYKLRKEVVAISIKIDIINQKIKRHLKIHCKTKFQNIMIIQYAKTLLFQWCSLFCFCFKMKSTYNSHLDEILFLFCNNRIWIIITNRQIACANHSKMNWEDVGSVIMCR